MVQLTAFTSGLLTLIFLTAVSVTFEARLKESDEDNFNIRLNVLDHNPEGNLRLSVRHGRSRSHLLRSNRRTSSNKLFLNPISLESYDLSNNDENKILVSKSISNDREAGVKSRYEITTTSDVTEELDLSISSLDATVPKQSTERNSHLPPTPQTTTVSSHVNTATNHPVQTTVVLRTVKQGETKSSLKKPPDTYSSPINANESAQNSENRLRSAVDPTAHKAKDRLGDETGSTNEFANAQAKSHPTKDDSDEDFDSGVEETDSEVVDNVPVTIGETVDSKRGSVDVVTRFLTIVESQHLLGENCTAGTDLNLGEGVVDRYAQERFRVEADVAVNRANMLTRLWKYADPEVMSSEYLLHASVFSMVEFDEDIFAAGNCYDQFQYKDYVLFCPYAYRLPEGPILVKDLAVEYKYLSNTSEWFYIARKHAENVIRNYSQFSRGESKLFDYLKTCEQEPRSNDQNIYETISATCRYLPPRGDAALVTFPCTFGKHDTIALLNFLRALPYILESNPHPNLIRTSFCRYLKRKKS